MTKCFKEIHQIWLIVYIIRYFFLEIRKSISNLKWLFCSLITVHGLKASPPPNILKPFFEHSISRKTTFTKNKHYFLLCLYFAVFEIALKLF